MLQWLGFVVVVLGQLWEVNGGYSIIWYADLALGRGRLYWACAGAGWFPGVGMERSSLWWTSRWEDVCANGWLQSYGWYLMSGWNAAVNNTLFRLVRCQVVASFSCWQYSQKYEGG